MVPFAFKPGMVIVYRGRKGTENVIRVLDVHDLFGTPGPLSKVHHLFTYGYKGTTTERWDSAQDLVNGFSDAPLTEPPNLGRIIRIEEVEDRWPPTGTWASVR